jgi:hypothetical protein
MIAEAQGYYTTGTTGAQCRCARTAPTGVGFLSDASRTVDGRWRQGRSDKRKMPASTSLKI